MTTQNKYKTVLQEDGFIMSIEISHPSSDRKIRGLTSLMGDTGFSTDTNINYEVRVNGALVNLKVFSALNFMTSTKR